MKKLTDHTVKNGKYFIDYDLNWVSYFGSVTLCQLQVCTTLKGSYTGILRGRINFTQLKFCTVEIIMAEILHG